MFFRGLREMHHMVYVDVNSLKEAAADLRLLVRQPYHHVFLT